MYISKGQTSEHILCIRFSPKAKHFGIIHREVLTPQAVHHLRGEE